MRDFYNPKDNIFKEILLLGIFLVVAKTCFSQNINYSQLQFTPMQLNPAYTANTDYVSAVVNYRMNRIDLDNRFNYNQVSVMAPFYNEKTGFRTSGIGVSAFRDNFGAFDQYVFQGASLAYARQVRFNNSSSLGLGIMGGAFQKKISPENFTTGSQWVRNLGFNPDLGTGENFGDLRITYFNTAFGLNYIRYDRNGAGYFNAGFSIYNMNRPDETFLQDGQRQPFLYIGHVSYKLYSSPAFDINGDILFTSANNVNQINAGAVFSYKFENTNPFDPIQTGSIDILARYIVDNYFVLGVQISQPNFALGFSYDIGYKRFEQNSPVSGSTEFAFTLRKPIQRRRKSFTRTTSTTGEQTGYQVGQSRKFDFEEEKPQENTKAPTGTPQGEKGNLAVDEGLDIFEEWDGNYSSAPGKPMKLEKNFRFNFNEAELNEEAKAFLNDFYEMLIKNPGMKLLVTGHTDDVGSRTANQKVSYQRARIVMDYLLELGLDKRKVKAIGKSNLEPLVPNDSDRNRALNRRVEFSIFLN